MNPYKEELHFVWKSKSIHESNTLTVLFNVWCWNSMKPSSGHEKFAPYISKNDRPHSSAEPWDSTNKSQSLVRYGLGEVKRYIICTVYCTKGLDGLTSPRRTPILYNFILSCSLSTVPRKTWNQHPAPWQKFKFKQCDTIKIRANHHVHFFFLLFF